MESHARTLKHSTAKAEIHHSGTPFAPAGTVVFHVNTHVSHFHFFTVTGLSLPSATPAAVLAAVRAPGNDNPQYSDSFALTVNQIHPDSITFKIWRIDSSNDPSAPIRIDCMVVL
jgi:hypothetical protein